MENSKYKIEKGVPIPTCAVNKKYPLRELEIGDSFFVPDVTQVKITGAFNSHAPKKFSCRTLKDDKGNIKGVRVWRIA